MQMPQLLQLSNSSEFFRIHAMQGSNQKLEETIRMHVGRARLEKFSEQKKVSLWQILLIANFHHLPHAVRSSVATLALCKCDERELAV